MFSKFEYLFEKTIMRRNRFFSKIRIKMIKI